MKTAIPSSHPCRRTVLLRVKCSTASSLTGVPNERAARYEHVVCFGDDGSVGAIEVTFYRGPGGREGARRFRRAYPRRGPSHLYATQTQRS